MFPITITINTQDQLARVTAALLSSDSTMPSVEPTANTHPAQDSAKRTRAKPTETAPINNAKPEADAPVMAYQEVADLVSRFAARDRPATVALLSKFKLATLKEAQPAQFAEIHTAFSKALEASTQ